MIRKQHEVDEFEALNDARLAARATVEVSERTKLLERRLAQVEAMMQKRPVVEDLIVQVGELKQADAEMLRNVHGGLTAGTHAVPLGEDFVPKKASDTLIGYSGKLVGDDMSVEILTLEEAKATCIATERCLGFTMSKNGSIAVASTMFFKDSWNLVPDPNWISFARGNIACGCGETYCAPGSRLWSCCGCRDEFGICTTSAHGAHWGQYKLHSFDGSGCGGRAFVSENSPLEPQEVSYQPRHSGSVVHSGGPSGMEQNPFNPSIQHSIEEAVRQEIPSSVIIEAPPDEEISPPSAYTLHSIMEPPEVSAPLPSEPAGTPEAIPQTPEATQQPSIPLQQEPSMPVVHSMPSAAPQNTAVDREWQHNLSQALRLNQDHGASQAAAAHLVFPEIVSTPPPAEYLPAPSPSPSPRKMPSPDRTLWKGGSAGAEKFWKARAERGAGAGATGAYTPLTSHDKLTSRLWKELDAAGVDTRTLAANLAEEMATEDNTQEELFGNQQQQQLLDPPVVEATLPEEGTADQTIMYQLQNLQNQMATLANAVTTRQGSRPREGFRESTVSTSMPPTPPRMGHSTRERSPAIRIVLRDGRGTRSKEEFADDVCGALLLPFGSVVGMEAGLGCDQKLYFTSPSARHAGKLATTFVQKCNAPQKEQCIAVLGILSAVEEGTQLSRRRPRAAVPPAPVEAHTSAADDNNIYSTGSIGHTVGMGAGSIGHTATPQALHPTNTPVVLPPDPAAPDSVFGSTSAPAPYFPKTSFAPHASTHLSQARSLLDNWGSANPKVSTTM